MAWLLALIAMQDTGPGLVITSDEHAATLKQSVANNTVDTLMKGTDVLGGKAGVAVLYRVKPETSALIHDQATEIYYILEPYQPAAWPSLRWSDPARYTPFTGRSSVAARRSNVGSGSCGSRANRMP